VERLHQKVRLVVAASEFRPLLAAVTVALIGLYIGGVGRACGDGAVLGLLALVAHPSRRAFGLLLLAVAIAVLSFPPFSWPLIVCAFTPLFVLWREPAHWLKAGFQGFAFGLALAWCALPQLGMVFLKNEELVRTLAASVIGWQFFMLATTIHATRRLSIVVAAGVDAVVAAGLEACRVHFVEFPLLLVAQPVVNWPIAQWAYYVTIYGVSAAIYFISFIIGPKQVAQSGAKMPSWSSTLGGVVVLSTLCLGGWLIRGRVVSKPLPIDLVIVQPHLNGLTAVGVVKDGQLPLLRYWTHQALVKRRQQGKPIPQLVVWPEFATALSDDNIAAGTASLLGERRWAHAILFGAILKGSENRVTNSAILIDERGHIERYDKMKMIPFAETWPSWMPADSPFAAWIADFMGVQAPFKRGNRYRPLTLQSPGRQAIKIGVSLCCEAHFPELPQYRRENHVDILAHLMNEDWFTETYPELAWYATWNIQYRAIETRTWQVICATSAHSGLVGPDGELRAFLRQGAGTVDSWSWSDSK
jgi:apolipoprotein N-acyltransferase